jgi:DNA damage-binding protein 1
MAAADSRSTKAKAAYEARDIDQSMSAHLLPVHTEAMNEQGKYAKPIVFGGLDGVSTIFAFLAGASGAELNIAATVALGCAQLFAGALGMGLGEYLASKADNDVASREQAREQWEVENNPEGEVREMVEIYKSKGLSEEDAQFVAKTLSKYESFWVEHMMLHEIGMMPPDEDSWEAVAQGIVMFFSFLILGGLPLLAYVLAEYRYSDSTIRFYITCIASSLALLFLGVVKAHMADMGKLWGGLTMMCQGLMCAVGAYMIGNSLPQYLHIGS